jgi:hypothetical protein
MLPDLAIPPGKRFCVHCAMNGDTFLIAVERKIVEWRHDIGAAATIGQGCLDARSSRLYGLYEDELMRM